MDFDKSHINDLFRVIDRSFAELKRSSFKYPHVSYNVDFHALEQALKADIQHQAEKARIIDRGHSISYSTRTYDDTLKFLSGDKNEDNQADGQMRFFRNMYFKWAKDLIHDLSMEKHKMSMKWLDLTDVAKTIGSLEVN